MSSNYGFGGDEVREESSWRYPIGIFLATLILCAIFLYYYVGPTPDELAGTRPSPTVSAEIVNFSISDLRFQVPANHTVFPRERRGGTLESISLYALWPSLSGYTPASKLDFIDDEAESRRIDITLIARNSIYSEEERIETLYLPHTVDQRGSRTPYRLKRYTFREQRDNVPTNGYADSTLFLGEASDGKTMALFCYRDDLPTFPSPECWREYELNNDISITYRFKRPYLAEWYEIDEKVRDFVNDMLVSPVN